MGNNIKNKEFHEPVASPQEKETESEADVQNSSTCSEWFNTTRDEMILFEKFGEDYDEVVNKMSHTEKLKLKREVEQSEPKYTSEVYVTAVQDSPMQEPVQQNLAANYSPDIIPPSPPVPKPRKKSPLKAFNVFPKLTGNTANPGKNFKSSGSAQSTPNY